MKNTMKFILTMVMVLSVATLAQAASTSTITVKAVVPTLTGMTVTISKVVGTTWTTLASNTLMDFGTLSYNSTLGIYTAPHYFAVDVGVLNNSGSWSIQHTPSTIYNTTTGNTAQKLDSNINVSFMKQTETTEATIAKVSFAGSSRAITNTNVPVGSWLRVYYGLGTGSGDNTGVTPIVSSQPAGTYQGSVTLTLTP